MDYAVHSVDVFAAVLCAYWECEVGLMASIDLSRKYEELCIAFSWGTIIIK